MVKRYVPLLGIPYVVIALLCLSHVVLEGLRIPRHILTFNSMDGVRRSVLAYRQAHGRLPATLDESPPREGYGDSRVDGWDRRLIYTVGVNGLVTLVSHGKDGKPGGTGDDADTVGVFATEGDEVRLGTWVRDPWDDAPKEEPTPPEFLDQYERWSRRTLIIVMVPFFLALVTFAVTRIRHRRDALTQAEIDARAQTRLHGWIAWAASAGAAAYVCLLVFLLIGVERRMGIGMPVVVSAPLLVPLMLLYVTSFCVQDVMSGFIDCNFIEQVALWWSVYLCPLTTFRIIILLIGRRPIRSGDPVE